MHAESDIDLLVEFIPDREPGLIDLANMEFELQERFGREVEMRTPEDLSDFSGMK
jgi:predicted nucleotidyltransferase